MAIGIAQTRGGPGLDRAVARHHGRFDQYVAGVAAIRPRVHPHGATNRARHPAHKFEPRNARIAPAAGAGDPHRAATRTHPVSRLTPHLRPHPMTTHPPTPPTPK